MWSATILFIILPTNYNELVQISLATRELDIARHSVSKEKPFGKDGWTDGMMKLSCGTLKPQGLWYLGQV